MIPVTKTYLPSFEKYCGQLKSVWHSGWLTNNGTAAQKLRNELDLYLGVSNLELVANGTLALQLALKSLDVKGEVITTPYSYVATTTAIMWEGCDPVFVDVDEKTFCVNPDLIELSITENTSAIVATHVYGYPCDVEKIEAIAQKHNLKVIYDAAHSFGVKLNGSSLLSYGDCSILSFHATKLFHTVEGGAVISKSDETSYRVSLMKKFGHIGEDEYLDIGINAKMSELHAAMGLCVLPEVSDLIYQRKTLAQLYDKFFDGSCVSVSAAPSELEHNYGYYPIILPSHDIMLNCRQLLLDNDIVPRRYFSPSLNKLPYLKPELKVNCPVSEDIASRVLCLPLYAELSKLNVSVISNLVLRACK